MKFGWKQTIGLLAVIGALAASPYYFPKIDLKIPTTVEELLDAGMEAQQKENYFKARELFSRAIDKEPGNGEAYFLRGSAELHLNYLDRAIKDFSRALQLDPSLVNAYFNRGAALAKKGLYKAAVTDFSKSLELRPNDVEALRERGLARQNDGDRFGAIEDFEKAIQLNEEYALAHLNLGLLQIEMNLVEDGLDHLNLAVTKQPEYLENFKAPTGCGPVWNQSTQEVVMESSSCSSAQD
ncbi:MAG: tetratricopeptide repeat protein [Bdellovibrionales bacterium]|nr:tetratricopeptide repeat protein [Bdellovibrionales bacterium]